ncbi:MAG: DUF1460 domain-containing protein [Proteobacteria bacterium]|nr:DUF1460 domain-containing protein [Pseudomonadota bacterium]
MYNACNARRTLRIVLLLFFVSVNTAAAEYKEIVNTGTWTPDGLDKMLAESSRIKGSDERIDFLSKQFLGVAYKESTLTGDINTPEKLVINLSGVDCFTFLDYVEAMRLSDSCAAFKDNLKKVRYQSGIVSYKTRNHFFTDWRECNAAYIEDVSGQIGAEKTKRVMKVLNGKAGGKQLLPGIESKKREISYIPSEAIHDSMLDTLRTGDYVGIYSTKNNLDVSHVGIVIREGDTILFRHASSEVRMVVDEDFKDYIKNKPGVIIVRSRNVKSYQDR